MNRKRVHRGRPDPLSHQDPKKQFSAAFYNLHEARICFENVQKLIQTPSHMKHRIDEINELLDYLKRRVLSFQDELDTESE